MGKNNNSETTYKIEQIQVYMIKEGSKYDPEFGTQVAVKNHIKILLVLSDENKETYRKSCVVGRQFFTYDKLKDIFSGEPLTWDNKVREMLTISEKEIIILPTDRPWVSPGTILRTDRTQELKSNLNEILKDALSNS